MEIINDLVRKKYSSFLSNNDRMLEVNSMIYLYNNSKINNLNSFEISLSNFTIHLSDNQILDQENSNISINKKLFLNGFKTFGRLDIYMKSHIFKQILNLHLKSVQNDLVKEFTNSLNMMEKDISRIISTAESQVMTEEKYMKFVEKFVNKTMTKEPLKELKKLFSVYQYVNDESSLKVCERLFIQLLGHSEKDFRDEAVKLLNMLYDETNWQEKESYKETSILNIGEEFNLEIILRKKDFEEENTMLVSCSPSYSVKVPFNVIAWNPISSSELITVILITNLA